MSRTCRKCDRSLYSRGLCKPHWREAKPRGFDIPLPTDPKLLAQMGKNSSCVDCAAEPMFGGLRCLPCFQDRAYQRQERQAA